MLISDGLELVMHALKCTKCLTGNRIWNVHKNIPKLEFRLKVRMLDNQIEQKEGKIVSQPRGSSQNAGSFKA